MLSGDVDFPFGPIAPLPSLVHATRVLLVEDDPLTRHLVRKTFMGQCQFVTAGNAANAIQMCESFFPDIVFLDLGLPDAPGQAVFEWLRLNQPKASVILFTQNHDLTVIDSLLIDGADGYIAKPFSRQDLMHYLLTR